jgi:uncharacterized damage-inducible protein DinB
VRQAEELVHVLDLIWHMIENVLARWTPADLSHVLEGQPDDPTERTCQWIVYHVLEHDIFHGGEISCILGSHGMAAVALE